MVSHLSIVKDAAPVHHSDRIYDILLGRLQRGEIPPGTRLIDAALAQEFNVSRMPARDALMRLAHHGYLERSTRGFVLPRLNRREILDVFELRRLIEPQAVAHAAQAMTPVQLAAFERALEDAKAAVFHANTVGVFRACEVMRNCWISAVPNAALRNTVMRYMTHIQVVRMKTFNFAPNQAIVVQAYEDMLIALRKRDGLAAAGRLLRFIFEGETAFCAAEKEPAAARHTSSRESISP